MEVELRPFHAGIDWLTVNMDVPPSNGQRLLPWQAPEPRPWGVEQLDPDRVYFTRPTIRRTSQFNRVTEVVDHMERKVMTVWHEPHNCGLHDASWIQVQMANHTFATGEAWELLRMLRAMGCTMRGISRLDIACDGLKGSGGDWPKVIDMQRNGNVRSYAKCDWIVRHSRGQTIGGEFGHRGSNKFIRAYRKCREMKRKGIKEHLVKQWERALGFNPMATGHEVNRFEVQLKGKEIRRYFPDERGQRAFDFVLSLADTANVVDVFASMAPGMFDFRTRATRARKAKSVTRWDWSGIVPAEPSLAFRAQRRYAVTEHTKKVELHAAFRTAQVLASPEGIEACRRDAWCYSPAMGEWFEKKTVEWTKRLGKLWREGDARTMAYFDALRLPDMPQLPPDPLQGAYMDGLVAFVAGGTYHDEVIPPAAPPLDEPPAYDADDELMF